MDHNGTTLDEERVEAARCKLAGRIASLERKVSATVTDATDNVRATTSAIRDGVQTAYDTASQSVREALNVRQHVRTSPWASVGFGAAAGFLAGFLPGQVKSRAVYASAGSSGPGPLSMLMDILKREMVAVGEAAIVTASTALRNNVVACAEPQRRFTAAEMSG